MFLCEFCWIDRDSILRCWPSHDEEIRNPWYRRERLSEFCLCIETEIWLTHTWVSRSESEPENFSHQCWLRCNSEMYSIRQGDRLDFLIHSLTIDIHCTSPVEFYIHNWESSCWARSHCIYSWYRSECSFEGESDDFFDILRTHSFGFSKYRDTRTIEIWEDIDREMGKTIKPKKCNNQIEAENQRSSIECKFDKSIEHDDYGWVDKIALTSISSFHFGFEASVTTCVSSLSHSVTIYFSPMIS